MSVAPEYLRAPGRGTGPVLGSGPGPGNGLPEQDDDLVSLRDLWRVVLKRHRQVLLVAALVLLV